MSDEVRPPAVADEDWLRRAEQLILNLLRDRYGQVSLDHTEADLELVQRLINDKALKRKQSLEQQYLGVVLGNVFVAQTSMKWAIVSNEYGTMLALHSSKIGFTLYPITMISKRMEGRRSVVISAMYRSFVADLGLSKGSDVN